MGRVVPETDVDRFLRLEARIPKSIDRIFRIIRGAITTAAYFTTELLTDYFVELKGHLSLLQKKKEHKIIHDHTIAK